MPGDLYWTKSLAADTTGNPTLFGTGYNTGNPTLVGSGATFEVNPI